MSTNTPEIAAQLLDQLQHEMNGVLEQMGRVFIEYNENPKVVPTVPFNKLTQMLPGSNNNFHEALDQLERELQLAKLVMRRDLAVCRERSGLVKPAPTTGTATVEDASNQHANATASSTVENGAAAKTLEDAPTRDAQANDTEMTDAPNENAAHEQTSSDTVLADNKPEDQPEKPHSQPTTTQDDSKASDTALQIDTKAQSKPAEGEKAQGEEDVPPDTGTFSNTNDLDSLFGGPTSAGPGDGGEFNLDPNNNADFDFGFDTGAENDDNITSLLPGLQDYANNPGGGATDFDGIFDLPTDTNQNENTFDDLLDFEDFTTGDFGGGDGNNNNNNGDTDFNFSFD